MPKSVNNAILPSSDLLSWYWLYARSAQEGSHLNVEPDSVSQLVAGVFRNLQHQNMFHRVRLDVALWVSTRFCKFEDGIQKASPSQKMSSSRKICPEGGEHHNAACNQSCHVEATKEPLTCRTIL